MKDYKRLTEKRETPLVMSQWSGDSNSLKIYNRLSKLEDKIESGEIVDRNSYLDRLMAAKDISGMSDKEIEFFAKHNARVRENADAEIARLTAEVAELRRRLGQDEFPCKVGDTIYYINPFRLRPKIEKFKVISLVKEKPNYIKIFVGDDEFFFVGDEGLFFIYNKAEARLKELQGGER